VSKQFAQGHYPVE